MTKETKSPSTTVPVGHAQRPIAELGPLPPRIEDAFSRYRIASFGQALRFLRDLESDDVASKSLGVTPDDLRQILEKLAPMVPAETDRPSRHASIPGGVPLPEEGTPDHDAPAPSSHPDDGSPEDDSR